MNYVIIIILGILILGPISYGYYLDFKSDPKEFKFGLKKLKPVLIKVLILIFLYFGVNKASEFFFPVNKNHGIEFNNEREKLGIPEIGENWKIDEHYSDQFKIEWWKPKPRHGHFKKVIEYGIINVKKETDYYQNPKDKLSYGWSVYNYDDKTFNYYLELTNDKRISITDKGNLKLEKPTKTLNVTKSEFENYITE
jgi:hypothetical protein